MKNHIKNIKTKKILFGIVLMLMLLPIVQQKMNIIEVRPLNGAIATLESPDFNLSNWFDGSFQFEKQEFLNQKFGFRNSFVRLYNQTYFSFFNEPKAEGVVVGKENYLYEENYILAHLGRDFIGYDAIKEKVTKLKSVADSLEANGTDLIVVLAPGKGSFNPEYIPERFDPKRKTVSNYDIYRNELVAGNVHLLDLNQWFRDKKGETDYPLYPKTGVHWSRYGEILAIDSIASYMASIRNINMPKMVIEGIETPDTIRKTDDDIEKGMNLLFNIEDLKMGYPKLSFLEGDGYEKPKVITVGDSYYWGVFGSGITCRLFKDDQFWYYNELIHSSSLPEPLKVKNVDIKEEIEKSDVVMLLCTDANLYKFPFGFIDQLHDAYFGKTHDQARFEHYVNAIKGTPEWLIMIENQAKMDGLSVDEAIRQNAEYMVMEEEKKKVEMKIK
jgi:hypothetical protein